MAIEIEGYDKTYGKQDPLSIQSSLWWVIALNFKQNVFFIVGSVMYTQIFQMLGIKLK